MQIKLNLSRKANFALILVLSCLGLSGVVAANVITANNGNSLNLGAGEVSTAACDQTISITGTKTGSSITDWTYTGFTLSGITLTAASGSVDPIGCGGKLMHLAIIKDDNTLQQATWSLPVSSSSYSFTFATSSVATTGKLLGSTYYASTALNSFLMSGLKSLSVGISDR